MSVKTFVKKNFAKIAPVDVEWHKTDFIALGCPRGFSKIMKHNLGRKGAVRDVSQEHKGQAIEVF